MQSNNYDKLLSGQFQFSSMKVLIISHDASRTGAPILLLNFAKLLKKHEVETEFLLKYGGDLEGEFHEQGVTRIYYYKESNSIFYRIRKKLFGRPHHNLAGLDWKNYNYILSNTITNGDILDVIKKFHAVPVLSYIHEMKMAARFFTTPENIASVKRHSNFYITPSQAVKNFLVKVENIPAESVDVLPSYIPAASSSKSELGRRGADDFFYVGSAGTIDWRKSPDLFVQVARAVFSKEPDAKIKFLWKGAPKGGVELDRILYDIDLAGISNKIEIAAASDNIGEWYQNLDIFLLTSREDPYPLVVLEAAAAGVPAICFESAGGAPEFVKEAMAGRVIPFLDINAMAEAVLYYYNNRAEARREGMIAKEKLKSRHQDIEMIYNAYSIILKKLFSYGKKNTLNSDLSSTIPSHTGK